MNRIYWTVPGKPIPQARHRTNKGRTYDPSAKAKQEFNLQSRRYAPSEPISGPVLLYLVFYMPVPKGALKAFKKIVDLHDKTFAIPRYQCQRTFSSLKGMFHTKRPDSTNLQKLVEDALNGLFWIDDSQVQIMGAPKIYSHNPRTEVEIYYE